MQADAGLREHVVEFERLDEIGVEKHRAIGQGQVATHRLDDPSELAQALQRIPDQHQRRIRADAFGTLVHQRGRRAGRQRAGDMVMAVMVGTGQRDEQIALADRAAVDRDAVRLPIRTLRRAAGRLDGLILCPESGDAPSFTALRASSASSNGSTVVPTIWPLS